uniref:Uncharacterized protein n=1 Tax=Plectus sambesii TaxID=2011161 RepID=A0A914VCJ4_9BILA
MRFSGLRSLGKSAAGVMYYAAIVCGVVSSADKRAFHRNRSHGSCGCGGDGEDVEDGLLLSFKRGRHSCLCERESTGGGRALFRPRPQRLRTGSAHRSQRRPARLVSENGHRPAPLTRVLTAPTQFPSPPAHGYISLMSLLRSLTSLSLAPTTHFPLP